MQLGRIPLHYAVQTNLPTVIMLLAKDMSLLSVADFVSPPFFKKKQFVIIRGSPTPNFEILLFYLVETPGGVENY